ncbi:hypothetical protein M5X11_16130 [Paenibacillus alginolyticus]|uniref:hypothetical protein n=1 Tax=Paenibacillus alginolyticus TaxID=59839 RepID=UPI00042A93B5|nr:hypothetical protein [Paenibacillus alginolyticus]MCY9666473.1 hypothetical protein [Paenibacillus alginolyticus]
MDKQFSTIGYGYLLEETLVLLDAALYSKSAQFVRDDCISRWPQKSESNKEKLWQHMKYRYLEIENNLIKDTPFLKMFRKIRTNDEAVQDLVFFQLCITTPIIFETLLLLVTDSFLNTGEAVFSRYHLDQLLERKYERMPQSTRDRVRSILVKGGRLILSKSNYSVTTYCPTEAVLGYALYHDALINGWRAPSTVTVINEGVIAPIFMCNRTLLIAGVNKLATMGHCEYHRHGNTDQVQLTHQSLEEYVDAWR